MARTLQLSLPHPDDSTRTVAWNKSAFDVDGQPKRVLVYQVGASGWTDELTELHEAEASDGKHFIDVASRRHALSEIARVRKSDDDVVMEIGVSSGFMLRDIVARFPNGRLIGGDYTAGTLQRLGSRLDGVPLVRFDLTNNQLPDGFVDTFVLTNVLEHIEDDAKAVRELYRMLKPGGHAIIEIPAGSALFDAYDKALMHFRRYDMRDALRLFESAGFEVTRKSHLGFFVYPLFDFSKRRNQKRYKNLSDEDLQKLVAQMVSASGAMNGPMSGVMWLERVLRRVVPMPFGIRCLLTCRKPESGRA